MVIFNQAFTATNGMYEGLKKRYKSLKEDDIDRFILIIGRIRRGKTTLALRILFDFMKSELPKETKDYYEYLNKRISVNGNAVYYGSMIEQNKHKVLILDEAQKCLYSRNAMKEENKELLLKFMECGFKNHLHLVVLPDLYAIDTSLRQDSSEARIDTIIKITSRGKFLAYQEYKAKKIASDKLKKGWLRFSPDSMGQWPITMEEDFIPFVEAYKKLEAEFKGTRKNQAGGCEEADPKEGFKLDRIDRLLLKWHKEGKTYVDMGNRLEISPSAVCQRINKYKVMDSIYNEI